MRTIVPFVLSFVVSNVLCAQPPAPIAQTNPQIAQLENKIADGRETMQDRLSLANFYLTARNVEGRRRQVLWLIEHHPEAANPKNRTFDLGLSGQVPDGVGFEQATSLWRTVVAKPGAAPNVIANAAWFFRFADREFSWSLVKRAEMDHPGDQELSRVRGLLDAITIGGVTENLPFRTPSERERLSSEARRAYQDVESSADSFLIGTAAEFIQQQPSSFVDVPAFHDQDEFAVAERWLLRAIRIDPDNKDWKNSLTLVYAAEARLTADPVWKVELLRKSRNVGPLMASALAELAMAEFEAGNNAEAVDVAHFILSKWENPGPVFAPNPVHIAHCALGRVALAQGNLVEAQSQLLQSEELRLPGAFSSAPNLVLAQELADAGARDTVIEFLERWRRIWPNDGGSIDHNIKLLRSPGHPVLQNGYAAGAFLRGREAPKLPIADYAGKLTGVQFRTSSCKTCDEQFALIRKIAQGRDIVTATIDAGEQRSLVSQLEIETFPTTVWIGRDGRVAEYQPGNVNESQVRALVQRLTSAGGLQRLPAPVAIPVTKSGTLEWSPVTGAESYVVQWDQRDDKGWISDRDEHLVRVIPTHESSVTLDPALGETNPGTIRWRVFAVSRFGPGAVSEWREINLPKP